MSWRFNAALLKFVFYDFNEQLSHQSQSVPTSAHTEHVPKKPNWCPSFARGLTDRSIVSTKEIVEASGGVCVCVSDHLT